MSAVARSFGRLCIPVMKLKQVVFFAPCWAKAEVLTPETREVALPKDRDTKWERWEQIKMCEPVALTEMPYCGRIDI